MKYLFIIVSLFSFLSAGEYEKNRSVVINTTDKLIWQDDVEVTEYLETFITAEVYCDTIVLQGFDDWRVPSIYELLQIVDVNEKNAINKKFQFVKPNFYSTSTSFQDDDSFLWGVDFKTGKITRDKKTNSNFIRCVRDVI